MDHELISAISVALLGGRIFNTRNVTAGNGSVIDWRTVKSGETIIDGADAYDTAVAFVGLVGWGAAARALDAEPV